MAYLLILPRLGSYAAPKIPKRKLLEVFNYIMQSIENQFIAF
ncbi:MAG: hypothetical protein U5L45_25310 [Saprospiraceae bacterium]|nr:hypothetical protein [Saprospiraceae bacterium]